MLLEDEKKIVPGVGGFICAPAVDEDGPLASAAAISSWRMRPITLHVAGRALVVVVEADFAAGDDFRLGEKRGEPGEGFIVGCGVLCG
jgi:hypothetical protein